MIRHNKINLFMKHFSVSLDCEDNLFKIIKP